LVAGLIDQLIQLTLLLPFFVVLYAILFRVSPTIANTAKAVSFFMRDIPALAILCSKQIVSLFLFE